LTRPAKKDEWGVLKVGAVSFGWFDESQNKALPPELKPRELYEVKSGDLIISRANIARYVGACALVSDVRPNLMLCDKLFRVIWK
jgi:type I restriction enzyme S subunit